MVKKIYYKIEMWLIVIDMNVIFRMKSSKFEMSHSVDYYDEKTAEK